MQHLKVGCSFSCLPLTLLRGSQKDALGEKKYSSAMSLSSLIHPQRGDADFLKLTQKHRLLSQSYGIFLIFASLTFF